MHSFAAVGGSAFWPLDYINQGTTNTVWAIPFGLARSLIVPGLKDDHDEIFGIAPALFALALYGARRFRRDIRFDLMASIAVAVLVCWLSMFRGIWGAVYLVVPGAKGIRVVGRFNLVLLVPVILIATVLLDHVVRRTWSAVLALLLLGEEMDSTAPVRLDQAVQQAMIADARKAIPSDCASFYVTSSRRAGYPVVDRKNDHLYAHNVDAMVLSEVIGKPTVNGFSTFLPPGWNFDDPQSPTYRQRVLRYAARVGIAPPCELAVASR